MKSPESNQRKAYLLAITAVLFWSTVPTAFKLGLRYQDNYQMVTGATLISTALLFIILILQGKLRHFSAISSKHIFRAAILGFLNPAFYYLILFKAYDLLPGQVAQPLNMVWPIVLVLISIPLLGQKIGWRSILAMIISFIGVVTLSLQGGNLFSEKTGLTGVLLALFTAFIWAFYWIYNMRSNIDEVLGLFLAFAFGSAYLLLGGIFRQPFLPSGSEAWYAAAYIGVFEMGLTFVLWIMALHRSSTTARISNLVFLAPFINLFFMHYILKESIYISTIFGIILVVTGILFQQYARKQEARD